jgi:hypothetical protein
MSLLYESIITVVTGGVLQTYREINENDLLGDLCMEKLKVFLENDDPNRKITHYK